MAIIRSADEIILDLLELYKQSLPNLDTKVGTVARDLFIDAPSVEISKLYDELANISDKQSFRMVAGTDLDKLAKNFGITRRQASASSGVALLTFNDLSATISINNNSTVIANNNFTFSITSGASISPANANFYKSVVSKYRQQLDFLGISDQYAIELTAVATAPGSVGNIPKYGLNSTTIPGISNVTNMNAFVGGSDTENDTTFRNRVLSSFSGSSVGTALGYLNSALSITGVSDAIVIEPGDPLMTRDGTVSKTNSDGSLSVVSEGSGGKVDIIIMGSNLTTITDSYVYVDKSNNNDPTNSKNDVVLGQIIGDENKTINKKRIDNIKQQTLPTQPVESILSVNGTLSGANFKPKSIDSYGRVSGNFELLKDTGVFSGSPWGFDKLHWISDYISLHEEDTIKGQFNSQDPTVFSGILEIPEITQNIQITNENSQVLSDRSYIRVLHTPATNITRVVNVNTGERYVVSDQNPDKTGLYNTTGKIKISGNTLPTSSDTLQVDYNWIISYDQYSDYDGLSNTDNARVVNDSVDWGYSSLVSNELVSFESDISGDYYIGTTSHSIDTIINVNSFSQVDGVVSIVDSGIYVNRYALNLYNLESPIESVSSVVLKNTNTELFDTSQNDGAIINKAVVIGVNIMYNSTIILPTDTSAVLNNSASAIFNSADIYTSGNGSSNNNKITISSSALTTTSSKVYLNVSYLAATTELLSNSISTLPANRSGNGFVNYVANVNYSKANMVRRESATIKKNLSAEYYVDLTLPVLNTSINVLAVVRASDGELLWSSDYVGIIDDSGTTYQLILDGSGVPLEDQKVVVLYYATDLNKFQPFSFSNNIISTRSAQVISTTSGRKAVRLTSIVPETGVNYDIIENISNEVITASTDGIISLNGEFTASFNFSTIPDIINKKLRINNSLNSGIYDIVSYDSSTNKLKIKNDYSNINNQQVSVVRLLDNKEIYSGELDLANNYVYVDNANFGDYVYLMIFNYKNLKKSPTRLICTTTDQTVNSGVITVSGTTLNKVSDIVFTATNNGLKVNLTEAIKKSLNLQSSSSIPSNLVVSKILKLEKVSVVSPNSNEVFDVKATYDVKGSKVNDNTFYDDMVLDQSLNKFEVLLPSTSNNVANNPNIGDKFRVSFYYMLNESESLSYVKNGVLYTNKKFALIDRVFVSSGFKSSLSTKLSMSSLTQPTLGSRYKIFYNYTAPKQNERITVKYSYNKLISDTTLEIENTRPINADVIVKGANKVLVDLTMNIVINNDYKTSTKSIVQSVKDRLISDMTFDTLNTLIDSVSLINTAESVVGVARARILYLNRTGTQGQVSIVQAQKNEYLVPNNIVVNVESR